MDSGLQLPKQRVSTINHNYRSSNKNDKYLMLGCFGLFGGGLGLEGAQEIQPQVTGSSLSKPAAACTLMASICWCFGISKCSWGDGTCRTM